MYPPINGFQFLKAFEQGRGEGDKSNFFRIVIFHNLSQFLFQFQSDEIDGREYSIFLYYFYFTREMWKKILNLMDDFLFTIIWSMGTFGSRSNWSCTCPQLSTEHHWRCRLVTVITIIMRYIIFKLSLSRIIFNLYFSL